MNDFDALLGEVTQEIRLLGIPISQNIEPKVRVNSRATARFGCCIRQGNRFLIELSDRLLSSGELACRQILAHELLHTCPGCQGHGPLWKAYASRMNAAYGYQIARTGSCESLGVPDKTPVRHLVVCEACGMEFKRARASLLVQHPERYRCKCGGRLRRQY